MITSCDRENGGGCGMNEWGFAAEVKTWWDPELSRHPQWGLSRCEVETKVLGGQTRSDLTVFGGGQARLCGELRLPDHPIPSPWHPDNLEDAVTKATNQGARWAFTSDGTTVVLIDTHRSGPPLTRIVDRIELVQFRTRDELDSETFLVRVADAWRLALHRLAPVIAGLELPAGMAPDELFINSLRAVLSIPVAACRHALNQKRISDSGFATSVILWMVDEQGWTHVPERWEQEIERVAQLTTYVFATRLLFYEALRRARPEIAPLTVPRGSAMVARTTLGALFEEARHRSGDYETLFTWDAACDFALADDACVDPWVRVVEHLGVFNLATIGFDLVGKMFERLIDPHERYLWGQHYTNPDVVDLMLSFALPDGSGKLLDPACGGGTFLVRAYARKARTQEASGHQRILSELFGLDVSAFAATLATVNLAVRNLEFQDNYPQVAVRSFFRVQPDSVVMRIPAPERVSLGIGETLPVEVGRVRAVACNPPYVRAHELVSGRREEAERALAAGPRTVALPTKLSGLSNYHVYFWLHAAQFLEDDGRLVFITSGEWLDSDYGVPLQQWLLDNFMIECVVESIAEPWFSEARVGTVVVCARRCAEGELREANSVRFVLLRRRLAEFYGLHEDDGTRLRAVDGLRDRLLALDGMNGETEELDWSIVSQAELRSHGTRPAGTRSDD